MTGGGLARLGGICGLLYVLLIAPAYIVGYFGASPGTFVFANGTLAVFSSFFFLWFFGCFVWPAALR